MIEKKINKEKDIESIVIRPNPAMPWHIIKKIYLFFGCFILLITIVLSYINLYLVIPFYGIEFILLGYALYITALKSKFYEEIVVSAYNIKVRFVMKKNIKEYDLVKDWTRFKYEPPTKLKRSILYFFHQNKKILIGQIVTDEERAELKNIIKNMGLS
jgi:uncharacterized membrane protein